MTPQEMYDHLVETVKSYNPSAGFDQIRAAYEYAAAHHAEAQQTDVHRNTPCPFDVASFYPVQPLLSIWEKSRTGGVRLL